MTIPPFDENGYLPSGIHQATLEEIADRFGQQSEVRRVQMVSLRWLVEASLGANIQRLVINGSFVTDVLEPNDVDCVLLPEGAVSGDPATVESLLEGFPFLDVQIVDQEAFDWLIGSFFAANRHLIAKGMIEVIL